MFYARIENGIVAEKIETDGDITKLYHPSLVFIECNNSVSEGDLYQNGIFSKPSPAVIDKREAMQCTAWQLRRALTAMGLRLDVETAIAGAGQDAIDMWEYAITYHRLHPLVLSLAAALGKADIEIDTLFELALTFTE